MHLDLVVLVGTGLVGLAIWGLMLVSAIAVEEMREPDTKQFDQLGSAEAAGEQKEKENERLDVAEVHELSGINYDHLLDDNPPGLSLVGRFVVSDKDL